MRILAIDFGDRRIGLATCDATEQVVTPRRTVLRQSDSQAAREIALFCREEEVEQIVLGLPRTPEGAESPFAERVRSFRKKLSSIAPVPIEFHEETLTSWEAEHRLGSGPHDKAEIDRKAAAVLLTDYLAEKAGKRR
jgi:putative Holliday junction resolvase